MIGNSGSRDRPAIRRTADRKREPVPEGGPRLPVLRPLRFLWLILPLLLLQGARRFVPAGLPGLSSVLSLPEAAVLLAVAGISFPVLSLRWSFLLSRRGRPVPLPVLGVYRAAGFAVSYLTPGPQVGGEPLQIALLSKRRGVPYRESTAVLLLDRTFELTGTFLFFAIAGSFLLFFSSPVLTTTGTGGGSTVLLPVLAAVVLPLAVPGAYLLLLSGGVRPLCAFAGWTVRSAVPADAGGNPVAAGRSGPGPSHRFRRIVRRAAEILAGIERELAAFRPAGGERFFLLLTLSFPWLLTFIELRLLFHALGTPVSPVQLAAIMLGVRAAFLLPVPAAAGVLESSQAALFPIIGLPVEAAIHFLFYTRIRDLLFAGAGLAAGSLLMKGLGRNPR